MCKEGDLFLYGRVLYEIVGVGEHHYKVQAINTKGKLTTNLEKYAVECLCSKVDNTARILYG